MSATPFTADQERALTDPQRKALTIVRDNPGITAGFFATLMWPDSGGWEKRSKAGNYGTRSGAGMPRAGGSYLAVLRSKGWLERKTSWSGRQFEYRLTATGERLLRPD